MTKIKEDIFTLRIQINIKEQSSFDFFATDRQDKLTFFNFSTLQKCVFSYILQYFARNACCSHVIT